MFLFDLYLVSFATLQIFAISNGLLLLLMTKKEMYQIQICIVGFMGLKNKTKKKIQVN